MNNLQWQFLDCNSNPLSNVKVLFTPTKAPEITSSYQSVFDSYQFSTSFDGTITSSVVESIYKVEIANPSPASTFFIKATSTGSFLYSGSFITGSAQCVYFDLINLVKYPLQVKKVTLTPKNVYPVIFSGSIIPLCSTSSNTDSTGFVEFDALVPGVYQVDALGKVDTQWNISVPAWNGTGSNYPCWNSKDLIIVKPAKGIPVKLNNADTSYVLTVSSSDARYWPIAGNIPVPDTASWAINAVWADTASVALTSISSSWAGQTISASHATQADNSDTSTSSSHALEADHAVSASWAPMPLVSNSSSWASSSISASWSDESFHSVYAESASWVSGSGTAGSASWASASLSASWADTASVFIITQVTQSVIYMESASWASASLRTNQAISADFAYLAQEAVSASVAVSASWAPIPVASDSASWASSSISASHAETASFTYLAQVAGYATSAANADSASYADHAVSASWAPPIQSDYSVSSSWASASLSSSWSAHADNADEASHSLYSDNSANASFADASTTADTSSYVYLAENALWASSSLSASYSDNALSASWAPMPTISNSSSWASSSVSASYSEQALSASWAPMPVASDSASWASSSISASYSEYANQALSASWAPDQTVMVESASWASSSLSASLADNAKTASYLYLSQSYIDSESGSTEPAWKEGRMWWDSTNHTYAIFNDNPNVSLQIGQEQYIHAVAGEAITDGKAVYIGGAIDDPDNASNHISIVYKAIADGTGTKSEVVGITTHAFTSGSAGWVTVNGKVNGLNTSTFANGAILWLDPLTAGEYTDTKPGQPFETIQVGYCVYSNVSAGKVLVSVNNIPAPANAYSGMTSIPTITDNTSSYDVTIGSGSVNLYDNPSGFGVIKGYDVPQRIFNVPPSTAASFIYATSNGVTASYEITDNLQNVNYINEVMVTVLYRADEDAHWMESKQEGLALANKLNNRLVETDKFAWEDGFSLFVTGSNYFGITAGELWFGASEISQEEFISFNTASVNPKFETHWAYHSASNWIIPIQSDGKWNSGYYDNGTNLTALGPDSWSVHYVYRILGENPYDEDVFLVTSNYQYQTELDAKADALPSGIPSVLDDVSLMVGRIIFQSGSTTGTVETALGANFGQSTVTQHNGLSGIQGGQGGQYYHSTLAEYTGTGTGVFMRNNQPTFVGATTGHIPYWKADQTLTLTGSLQVYGDQYVLINSGSPNPTNPEALLVYQKNTSSVNSVGVYADVDNYSQVYNQNLNSGSNASTDFVATADVGNQDTNFIDMGINGSGYTGSTWPWNKALDGYILMDSGDLWLGLATDNKLLFAFNNTASTNYADKTGFYLSGSLEGTASWARNAVSASWAPDQTVTASVALTASYFKSTLSASKAWHMYIDGNGNLITEFV